jgi:hypothetical protein
MRRFPPAFLGALTLLAPVLRASPAAAQSATVAVDCPAFDDETRAALDARARAELLVREQGGTLVVACRGGDATLTWHPLDGQPRARVAPLAADARSSIDHILEALDSVLANAPASGEGPGTAVIATPEQQPAPSVPAAPPRPPESPAPPEAEAEATRTPEGGKPPRRFRVAFGAGAIGELWSGSEALGGHLFAALALPSRFSVSVTGGGLWALRTPSSVSANIVRLGAGGDYGIDRAEHFRVGADVFADLVHAESSQAGSDDRAFVGASVRATAGFDVGRLRLQIGPTLAAHPGKVVVQIGDTEAFHVPTFAFGFRLDAVVAAF